jgi:hypothetical protein
LNIEESIALKLQRRSLCFFGLYREILDFIRQAYKHCQVYEELTNEINEGRNSMNFFLKEIMQIECIEE